MQSDAENDDMKGFSDSFLSKGLLVALFSCDQNQNIRTLRKTKKCTVSWDVGCIYFFVP